MAIFNRELTQDRIDAIVGAIEEHSNDDRLEQAWEASKPLRNVVGENRGSWEALLLLLQKSAFSTEHSLELATQLFQSRGHEPWALGDLGGALEAAHDIRYLNAAPPTATVFADVASALRSLAPSVSGTEDESRVLMGLCHAARLMGRSWDDVAEKAYLTLVELKPKSWARQYDLGLFYKTRGRFAEGLAANKAAAKLGGDEDDAVLWNLGICATGAGDGSTALSIWKDMGQRIEMGRFALPEGGYGSVKVRLAERPLATRNVAEQPDSPGQEETIWIERLSPCHGIVRARSTTSSALTTAMSCSSMAPQSLRIRTTANPFPYFRTWRQSGPADSESTDLAAPKTKTGRSTACRNHSPMKLCSTRTPSRCEICAQPVGRARLWSTQVTSRFIMVSSRGSSACRKP